jgi:pimeloyl-ACP methyl ester carboxylesterase
MSKIHRIPVAPGVELECQEMGAGLRPFVLVHGFTGSRDDWREHMEPLATHGWTLALDQRGHGGSSNPGDAGGYGFDRLSADLAEALDALGATPCDLLGHSMGGMVALRYALAHQDRVHSLILMDTAASAPARPDAARKVMEGMAQLARASGMDAVTGLVRGAMEGGGMGPPVVTAADAFDTSFDRVRPKLEQMDPEAFGSLGPQLFEQESIEDRLCEISCPTTVIVGEADLPFREASQIMADEIDGAELVVIPEAAHQPQLENPRAWREAVERHLHRVRESG